MTELYDDCNFKNKEKITFFKVGEGWYNLAFMDMEYRANTELNCKALDLLWTMETPRFMYAQKLDEVVLESNYRDGKGY